MELITKFEFNQKVYSKSLMRNVIVNNISISTYGSVIKKKTKTCYITGKYCSETYEVKYRDPNKNRLMSYDWVDVSDLEEIK